MCGILGYLGRASPPDPAAALNLISHRGPDGHGIWEDPNAPVWLGHRRLSILDLSEAGAQPMADADQRCVVVFNGEIYNYPELRKELEAKGRVFRSHCDTEVLLHLYLEEGPAFLPKLNGMFAFGLWDRLERRLLLARDGFGVKPLYLAQTPGGFAFASELKALLDVPGLSRDLDPAGLASYLTYLYSPGAPTLLRGVRKLEPGHARFIGPSGELLRAWRFAALPAGDRPLARLDAAEGAERLRTLFDQAVHRQMLSDVPVGSFLSGGLDSSSIVAFAKRHVPDQMLPCYTIGFRSEERGQGEGFVEDLPYAVKVANELGVPLRTVWVGREMAEQLPFMLWHLDEPQADLAALNAYAICRQARADGVKVLLSGAGGDDLFTGYRRHEAIQRERVWAWMPAPARAALRALTGRLPAGNPVGRRLAKAFQFADQPADRRLVGYFTWLQESWLRDLLTPALRAELAAHDPMAPMLDALAELPPGTPPLNRMLHLDARFFLADHNLNYTDKMSMAAGIEVRVPFLDPDLAAFAASLPLHLKQRGREGKWLLKKAMEPHLPHNVIYRPKSGFGVPLRTWLRGELAEVVEDTLSERSLRRRGIFNPQIVQKMRAWDLAGKADFTYPLFALVCIEMWLRLLSDGEGSRRFGSRPSP